MAPALDPTYVQARRVLLDALEALTPHRGAVIVAGAQAVYLHTGEGDLAIAPYTTDGDLALDPTLLEDHPQLEEAMSAAGFHLRVEPGIWFSTATIDGHAHTVPIDLIVPEGFATGGGRRAARLGPHGRRAARRVIGLEAALVDHCTMTIAALDPSDTRTIEVKVAGPAALFVAKAHKLRDRIAQGKPGRLDDKDAADVFRLMQATSPDAVGVTLASLADHTTAGPPTRTALDSIKNLFGSRRGAGIEMAARALRVGVPEARVRELCIGYVRRLLSAAGE